MVRKLIFIAIFLICVGTANGEAVRSEQTPTSALRAVEDAFTRVDTDGDRFVSLAEAQEAGCDNGARLTRFSQADRDSDGTLSFQETRNSRM